MTRPTIRRLITLPKKEGGLGYCCLWFYFTRFKRSRLTADRLGVTIQAVNAQERRVACGAEQCEKRGNCMDVVITMQLTPRKPRGEKLD